MYPEPKINYTVVIEKVKQMENAYPVCVAAFTVSLDGTIDASYTEDYQINVVPRTVCKTIYATRTDNSQI